MADRWFYLSAGKQQGPVSFDELVKLILTTQNPPDTLVWTQGLDRWTPAIQVPAIAKEFPPTIPESELIAKEESARPSVSFGGKCANCGLFLIATFAYEDNQGRKFCSRECMRWHNHPHDFCSKCLGETTDKTLKDLIRVNGTGFTLRGRYHPCPTCRSMIRKVVFSFLFVPTIGWHFYRIIYATPKSFLSRRVSDESAIKLGLK